MKIGEVSKMLNMSVDTIRFYEKMKVITPKRSGDGEYRDYSDSEIIHLIRCIKFRSMGLSLEEIVRILHEESVEFTLKCIIDEKDKLKKKIAEDTRLLNYMQAYSEKLSTIKYNLNNLWITYRPQIHYIISWKRIGKKYHHTDKPDKNHPIWVRKMPYVDEISLVSVEDALTGVQGDSDQWGLGIRSDLFDALGLEKDEKMLFLPQTLAAVTIIDAGEEGNYSLKLIHDAIEQTIRRGYEPCGTVTSSLLARNWESGRYHRYFEVQIPIKK